MGFYGFVPLFVLRGSPARGVNPRARGDKEREVERARGFQTRHICRITNAAAKEAIVEEPAANLQRREAVSSLRESAVFSSAQLLRDSFSIDSSECESSVRC